MVSAGGKLLKHPWRKVRLPLRNQVVSSLSFNEELGLYEHQSQK